MEVDRGLRQGLLKLHTVSVSEHVFLLRRLAHLHDLFFILTPQEFEDRETYYGDLCSSNIPLGVSWVEALDREDKYFSVLEILGRYILYDEPPLYKFLTQEQIQEANDKALKQLKKLMDMIY